VLPNGAVVPTDPIQFHVNGNCSFTGESQSGASTFSGRIQAGKRGVIGRFVYDDGQNFFEGPILAVRAGVVTRTPA
jgi:hypothetical protein